MMSRKAPSNTSWKPKRSIQLAYNIQNVINSSASYDSVMMLVRDRWRGKSNWHEGRGRGIRVARDAETQHTDKWKQF